MILCRMEEQMSKEELNLYGKFFDDCKKKFTGLNPRTEFKKKLAKLAKNNSGALFGHLQNMFLGLYLLKCFRKV